MADPPHAVLMLLIVHAAVVAPNNALPIISVRVDRLRLAKRLWRGTADDGREFGFELDQPLKDGATFLETASHRYVIAQEPEPVLEVALDVSPSAAAGIGWAIGNLHLELSADPARLLTPDDPAARQLLERIAVPYRITTAVFRPGRFVRGAGAAPTQDLGPSHRH